MHDEGKAFLSYIKDYFKSSQPSENVPVKIPKGLEPVQPAVAPAPIIEPPRIKSSTVSPDAKSETPKAAQKTNHAATFQEVARIPAGGQMALVISLYGSDGLIINEYINSPKYTGFTKKNVMINISDLHQFSAYLTAALGGSETKLSWYSGTRQSAEVHIRPVDEKVDVRQWLTEGAYTGYTLKGFRIEKRVAKQLAEKLLTIGN